jgi:hypothetical protein
MAGLRKRGRNDNIQLLLCIKEMKNCLNPYPSKVNSLAISMCKGIHVTEIPSIILWKIWTMTCSNGFNDLKCCLLKPYAAKVKVILIDGNSYMY